MSDLNFDSLFGDSAIDYDCPKCKAKIPITLNDVGETITCPKCGVKIEFQKYDSFDKSIDEVNNSLKDLNNTLNNLGK